MDSPTPTDAGRWGQIATATVAVLGAIWALGKWALDPLFDHMYRRRATRVFALELRRGRDSAIAIERMESTQGVLAREIEHMRDSVELIPELHNLAKGNADAINRVEKTQERLADAVARLAEQVGEVRGAQKTYDRRLS
jgi:hypothetical protein